MKVLISIIGLVMLVELFRDMSRPGDFIGYVQAGDLVLSGGFIYDDPLNTWPPLFSILCVPLALIDGISSQLVRFIWLLGNIVAMIFVVSESLKLLFQRSLDFKSLLPWKKEDAYSENKSTIKIIEPIVVIPLVIILRYMMDNMANIQINIYILLMALLAINSFINRKYILLGILLGLSISIKVYPIFLLLYFIYKREWIPVVWSVLFLFVFNLLPLIIFGIEQGLHYFYIWATEVAPHAFGANHKNQSVFGMLLRYLTDEHTHSLVHVNVLDLTPSLVKKITYTSIALAAVIPAWLFRNKLSNRSYLRPIIEYTFILTAIPILSPVAWKAYFIFLYVGYLLLYYLLYRVDNSLSNKKMVWLRGGFYLSIFCTILTTEAIWGRSISKYFFEMHSFITLGTILMLILLLIIYNDADHFEVDRSDYQ